MAKTITINTSCGLNICITSSLCGRSERSAPSVVGKGATATGRQCRARLLPEADASCLASGQPSKFMLRCRVFPGLHCCNICIIQENSAPVKPFLRKGVDKTEKMCYHKNTRKHRRRLLPSQAAKDNRLKLEAEGGYLFLCIVMYSSNRFMAKTITINTSCGLNICITSSLCGRSERSAPSVVGKGATATGRQCRARLLPEADASCLASGQPSKFMLRCRVFPGLHCCNICIIQENSAPVKPFLRKRG